MWSPGWGGMPNGVCGTGYMCLLLVLGPCTCFRMCFGIRYGHSVFLSVCPGGFSAITDVCADYLTGFITLFHVFPEIFNWIKVWRLCRPL